MWVLFNGISASDNFRIEVVTHLEYVPTLVFGSWSPPEAPVLNESDLTGFFREIRTNISDVISGDMGRALTGGVELGKKVGRGMRLVSAFF